MATQKQWGVTPFISAAPPTSQENELTDSLIEELKRQNNFEAPEETERRTTVLRQLQNVTVDFVKHVGQKKGLPQSTLDAAGGKVYTFGSYRLGVFGPGSDIDTLIVAPKHVTRDDFFDHFPTMLEKASSPGAVEELTPVPDAHVPIIKLEYSGISIDLIFAPLRLSSVPLSLDLKDSSLLRGLDDTDLRSVNGTRVTDEILELVPQTKVFRLALRAVKLWAQRRAVYANVIGFPGGVAWAMWIARTCQLYPAASASTIVLKFFHLMGPWPWPRPILLKAMDENNPLNQRVWNPQVYPSDKRHLMPIITPAYPQMCATHNITYSTRKIIVREIQRASKIMDQITAKKSDWKDFFQKQSFFSTGYKYYLAVVAGSRTKEAQQIWSGLVQSKVRRLVSGIEQSEAGVELAHPFNKGFERVHRCKTEEEVDIVFQGNLQYQVNDVETTEGNKNIMQAATAQGEGSGVQMPNGDSAVDETNGETSEKMIYTTTYYVGIELMPESKTLDITYPVSEFKRQCTDWPQFDQSLNSIRIIHTRNYDLPDDVFEPGEEKPQRKKKKANAQPDDSASKKRSFTATGLQEKEGSAKRQQNGNGIAAPAAG